jgi:hypothetical protein
MRYETNTEKLTRLMELSPAGPLIQPFVMTALRDYAKRVLDLPESCDETPAFINSAIWRKCAENVLTTLKEPTRELPDEPQ